MTVIIRKAERDDCESILKLKKEWAVQQNKSHLPMVSQQDLERDGFDSQPPFFHCLVAEDDKIVVGYALYYIAYPLWVGPGIYLEDLCVSGSCRGKGVGTLLLKELAQIGVDGNYSRITLDCGNWNHNAIKFYNKHFGVDYTRKEGWYMWSLPNVALQKLVQ